MGLLDGGIKTIVGNALPFLFLDFTIIRNTTTAPTNPTDPWKNPTVTETQYPVKAIITQFKYHEIDGEKIKAEDHKIVFLAASTNIEPAIDDRVQRVGETRRYLIVSPVRKDPAGATFTAQVR